MRHLLTPALALLLAVTFAGCGGDPEPQGGGGAEKPRPPANPWDLAAGIRSRTLANGLTVHVREKRNAPVVTCELAFKVGACDERDSERGLAHFLEHMLFKGSTSFKKGDIDRFTAANGGQNNAYTSRDMTAYHFTMPSSGLDAALKILKEMLGESTLDEVEFEKEKGPVREELHAGEDNPWSRLWERTQAKVYGAHPYRHPVIGYEQEVVDMKRSQMKDFYDRYYRATNAVLVIAGDVDAGETLEKVERMFGGIAKGTPVPPMEIVEPAQAGEVRDEKVEDVEVDRLIMAWRGPKAGEPDDDVLDLASSILGSGRLARLHQRLVEKDQLSAGIGVSNYSGRFPGTFLVEVEALPGADRGKIEAAIDEELARLAAEGPTEAELERAKTMTMASFVFEAESSANLADLIARFACTQSLEALGTYVDRLRAVTAEDVKSRLKKYIRRESRTVAWSIAGGDGNGGGGGGGKRAVGPRRAQKEASGAGGAAPVSLTQTRRVVLDNGLVLLLLENHDLPLFSVQSFSRSSALYEPEDQAGLSNLVGACLEDGTATRSSDAIALAVESVGGRLGTSATGVEISLLSRDRDIALELLVDILQNSTFPEDMVEQRKAIIANGIIGRKEQPTDQASAAFSEAIYGRHPLHRPGDGYLDTVQALTRAQCVEHHRKFFIPNNTAIAVVGDFDSAQVEAKLRALTAGWKMQLLDFPPIPEVARAAEARTKVLQFPRSKQVNVFVGHLGIRRNDPDWFPLLVMDHVFGTGSGFTDRLSRTIRDEMGLVYWVGGSIANRAGLEPGLFRCGFGTQPDQAKVDAALAVLRKELDRIRTEEVSAEELTLAKNYLLGSFTFQFETNAQLCDQLVYCERFGVGFDYAATYAKNVKAVSAADILRVAKKHLDPAVLLTVIAGPVDESGKVVVKEK